MSGVICPMTRTHNEGIMVVVMRAATHLESGEPTCCFQNQEPHPIKMTIWGIVQRMRLVLKSNNPKGRTNGKAHGGFRMTKTTRGGLGISDSNLKTLTGS